MPESLDPLEEAFDAALARPPAERAAYLKVIRGDNPAMAEEIAALLQAYDSSGDYLEQKPGEKFAESGREATIAARPRATGSTSASATPA